MRLLSVLKASQAEISRNQQTRFKWLRNAAKLYILLQSQHIAQSDFALNNQKIPFGCGKAYSCQFMGLSLIGIVVHLCLKTAVSLPLLHPSPVHCPTASGSLLSTTAAGTCLPAAPNQLRLPTSTNHLVIRSPGTGVLLSATAVQSSVSSASKAHAICQRAVVGSKSSSRDHIGREVWSDVYAPFERGGITPVLGFVPSQLTASLCQLFFLSISRI